jgi:SRSO17 transposase
LHRWSVRSKIEQDRPKNGRYHHQKKGIVDEKRSFLSSIGGRLQGFSRAFARHFRSGSANSSKYADQYIRGLMQARKKNMERMAEVVPDADEQQLQHFLSNSAWDERAVLDQVALEADEVLESNGDTALLIDESGLTKKGKHSVGVARQWNGRLGKQDNCQVGVFAALCRGKLSTLIDVRLFLPKEWVNDRKRCALAGVPEEARQRKTKPELALEMVRYNRQLGVRFDWVSADGLYGNNPMLLRSLDDDGETFVADVHKSQRIYLEDPDPHVPPTPANRRGRKLTKLVARTKAIRVDKWVETQPEKAWMTKALRESTKGKIWVKILHRRVWLWDGKEAQARCWHLVVRREIKKPLEIKYGLSNAPESTTPIRLVRMQAQRYWVERSFQDGKSHVGLNDYQVRGWRGWHHHMALVMMGMLFMLKERVVTQEDIPLLSCADIEVLLARFLPRRDVSAEEIIRQMEVRHSQRQASIDQAYAQQEVNQNLGPPQRVTK